LPPCRYRPAEAGRRSDSVKLRSAEADPHVTEREVPSRRRSDAGQLRRTSCSRRRSHRASAAGPTWAGRSDQGRGGSTPRDPPAHECRGQHRIRRSGGMRVRRTIAERIGFEALLRRQSPLSSGRRCRRPTLVPSMGFVPLRGPSCARFRPAVPGRRHPEARGFEERTRRHPAGRSRRGRAAGHGDPSLEFTHGAEPKPVVAATQGRPKPGHGPAPFQRGRPWPPCRDPAVVPAEAGDRREASARRVCPEHES
jgi:hypothetical protein